MQNIKDFDADVPHEVRANSKRQNVGRELQQEADVLPSSIHFDSQESLYAGDAEVAKTPSRAQYYRQYRKRKKAEYAQLMRIHRAVHFDSQQPSNAIANPPPAITMSARMVEQGSNISPKSKANGFEVKFHPETSPEERQHYIKLFPNVDDVLNERLHCTSCQAHFGAAPTKASMMKMHPVMMTTQCNKCYDFYNSGDFDKGEDGSELYCRWCGQGGEVYCCASCPYVFCKKCITGNLSRSVITDITKNDNWECFRCVPRPVWDVRARHWALTNYIEKRKKQIMADHKNNDDEIYLHLNADLSKCCRSRRISRQSSASNKKRKRVIESSEDEEDDDEDEDDEVGLESSSTSKKLKTNLGRVPASQSKEKPPVSAVEPDIVCTPDILSMFQPATIEEPDSSNQKRSRPNPPPLARIRPATVEHREVNSISVDNRMVVSSELPKGSPVYHTINGYSIDLNKASTQDAYKLPNGRMIQVKKNSSATGQTNSTQIQVRPVPQRFPQITAPAAFRPAVPYALPVNRPGLPIHHITPSSSAATNQANHRTQLSARHIQMQNLHIQQQQQLLNSLQMVPPSTVVQAHHRPPAQIQRHTVLQGRTVSALMHQYSNAAGTANAMSVPPANHSQSIPPATAGQLQHQLALVKKKYPNTQVGKEREKFEQDIFATNEICQQITTKLTMMMKSSAYKNANSFSDVKELRIHLCYLYKYIIGRYQSQHDSCQDDIKRIEPLISKAKDKRTKDINDGDDIAIVETKKICIEIDSDDDDEPADSTSPASDPQTQSAQPVSETAEPEDIPPANEIVLELPLPPLVETPPVPKESSIITNIDISKDYKLTGNARVVISRLESISRTSNAKIAQLFSRKKDAEDQPIGTADQLVELIEVDEEENVIDDRVIDLDAPGISSQTDVATNIDSSQALDATTESPKNIVDGNLVDPKTSSHENQVDLSKDASHKEIEPIHIDDVLESEEKHLKVPEKIDDPKTSHHDNQVDLTEDASNEDFEPIPVDDNPETDDKYSTDVPKKVADDSNRSSNTNQVNLYDDESHKEIEQNTIDDILETDAQNSTEVPDKIADGNVDDPNTSDHDNQVNLSENASQQDIETIPLGTLESDSNHSMDKVENASQSDTEPISLGDTLESDANNSMDGVENASQSDIEPISIGDTLESDANNSMDEVMPIDETIDLNTDLDEPDETQNEVVSDIGDETKPTESHNFSASTVVIDSDDENEFDSFAEASKVAQNEINSVSVDPTEEDQNLTNDSDLNDLLKDLSGSPATDATVNEILADPDLLVDPVKNDDIAPTVGNEETYRDNSEFDIFKESEDTVSSSDENDFTDAVETLSQGARSPERPQHQRVFKSINLTPSRL